MAYITIGELRDYLDLYDTDTYVPAFGADTLTLATVGFRERLKTAMAVTVSSTTADPPAPLAEGTVYYVILGADQVIQLATTTALANAGTQINLTDDGTGTHSITLESADTALLTDAISAAEVYIESQTNRTFSKSIEYHALAGADTLVLADTDLHHLFPTAAPVTVRSTLNDPPAPLVQGTIYYAIEVSDTVLQLATTAALALAGTEIDLTDTGTGTHVITRLQTQYYLHGAIDPWDNTLLHVDNDLLTVNVLTNGDSAGTAIASTDYWLVPFNLGPPYYAIQLKRDTGTYWQFDTDYRVSVLGTWGYSTTPPRDIKMAALHLAAFYRRKADAQVFDVTAIPDAGVITIPQGIPATVTRIIDRYKRYI